MGRNQRTREGLRRKGTSAGAQLSLRIIGRSEAHALAGPRFRIGSAPDNNLVLGDRYVSKRHCSVFREGDGLWVKDEGSRNGTWVNNIRVEQCVIEVGAHLVVGRTGLQVLGPALQSPGSPPLVGEHPRMLEVRDLVVRLGREPHPVLILGETGTGKEVVARQLHENSRFHGGPFEAVNCATIPTELAESELFGHVKGAFTGAERTREGAFCRADGGTLLLDEIGELPLELQPKLLRVLEEQQIRPVGSASLRPISVRVLAATHRDLGHEVGCGKFRLDLYHRLAVCIVELPPLRNRASDIDLLVRHFIDQQSRSGQPIELAPDVLPLLRRLKWPGNVRQLKTAIQRVLAVSGPVLTARDFHFVDDAIRSSVDDSVLIRGRSFPEIRREVYLKAIERHGGNRSAAATELRVAKSTFFDQLKAMGISGRR